MADTTDPGSPQAQDQAATLAPQAPSPQNKSAFDAMFDQAESSEKSGRNESALAKYPASVQQRARMLANYDAPVTPYMLTKSPAWNAAVTAATDYDRSFSVGQYEVRQGVKKAFAGGTEARALTSLNTAIGHLDSLKDAAEKLENFKWPVAFLNAPANAIESAAGDPRVNNFNERANAVSTELTRAFRGSGGAEADVKAWRANLPVNGSPDQQKQSVDGAIDLLSSRIGALKDQYTKGMGRPADFNFLGAKQRGILTKMGYDPDKIENGMKAEDARLTGGGSTAKPTAASSEITVTAPDGSVHPFDTQAQADTFKKLAGIK